MKMIQTLAVLMPLNFLFPANAQIVDPAEELIGMGVYVAAGDLDRSEAFYRTLFGRGASVRLDDFIAFDVAGGWFAIVSRQRYAPDSVPGSGAIPYIQAGDLEEIQVRAAAALGEPAPEIIVEPGIRLLKLKDPEGQLIEFFSLSPD